MKKVIVLTSLMLCLSACSTEENILIEDTPIVGAHTEVSDEHDHEGEDDIDINEGIVILSPEDYECTTSNEAGDIYKYDKFTVMCVTAENFDTQLKYYKDGKMDSTIVYINSDETYFETEHEAQYSKLYKIPDTGEFLEIDVFASDGSHDQLWNELNKFAVLIDGKDLSLRDDN